jgi:endonuclease/exonuclease/phosphatase family metal-dependent hydrolase
MPKITDPPPPEIASELADLRAELDQTIPPKLLDRNLLIATWNIRKLGEVAEEWVAKPGTFPRRDLHALRCMSEILSHFDVIAIQEVIGDGKGLRLILDVLGPNWGLLLTDPSPGALGNMERMAFLYDRRKVLPNGLVCELVIPQESIERGPADTLRRQFARTPYAAGFRTLDKSFTLVNLHIIYGKDLSERVKELNEIARWIANWAINGVTWDSNMIAVGDFQIETYGDLLYKAFTSTGLYVPKDLRQIPRTFLTPPGRPAKVFDQIAWFNGRGKVPRLTLKYIKGGNFDFSDRVMKSRGLEKRELAFVISDHLPIWAEFSVRDE